MEVITKNFYQNVADVPLAKKIGFLAFLIANLPMAFWQKMLLTIVMIVATLKKEEAVVTYVLELPDFFSTDLFKWWNSRALALLPVLCQVITGAAGLFIFLYTMRSLLRVLKQILSRRRYRSNRSYRPEALREGSLFEPGRVPSSQVEVSEVGVFSNTQIGYGLRLEDYLVLPTHVLESVSWPQNDLAIGKGSKALLLDMERYQDPMFDVSFFLLTPAQWAQVGVAKGSFSNAVAPDGFRVWCTGVKGRSHGLLKQSSPGMYTYSGSTLPGMSGSAYESQGCIMGMHVGASGSQNLGISSVYLWRRQELLVQEESKRNRGVLGLAAYEDPGQLMDQARSRWAVEDINDLLFAARSGDENVTKWLDKHRGTLGVHRYAYESKDAPKVLKRITEEVVPNPQCSCKELFHACEALRGSPNVSKHAKLGELPDAYVGQSDTAVLVQPDTVGAVAQRVRSLEGALEDNHNGVVRLTAENQELREQVAFLGKRLTVLEVWAIDRGYASIPKEVLTPQSPQKLALDNRKKTTPDVPKSQRKSALPLKHQDRYVGESSSKKIVTPPLVRKAKQAFNKIMAREEAPVGLELRLTSHQVYKSYRDKPDRSEEEQAWIQRYLEKRALKRKSRKARRSSQSPVSQSSSSSTH
uniref:Serine protease n=1 Tax=Soybean thrips sobemo-like virus 5 TaxID=2796569 RepID=A0A7T3UYL4_9VIRU|nr:hypothetical protein [Soybean thrips sobemo-like virus 5]